MHGNASGASDRDPTAAVFDAFYNTRHVASFERSIRNMTTAI